MVAMKKNPFSRSRYFFAAGAICAVFLSFACADAGEEAKETTVLEIGSRWRCLHVWGEELVRWESEEVTAFQPGKKGGPPIEKKEKKAPLSTNVPADWAGTDFDDSAWVPAPGPFRHAENLRDLAALYLRGKFEVSNPETVGELTLSLAYRGGVAVYLNGKEICRRHLPEGPLAPDTPAEAYAAEAYLDKEGLVITVERGKATSPEGVEARTRSLDGVKIPASALHRGVNVLALELRRAPTAECFFTKRPPKGANMDWTHLVLERLRLTTAGTGIEPEAGRAGKPRLWADNILSDLWNCDAALVGEEKRPIKIVGARNGAFSGVLAVRAAETIKRLSVEPGELKSADGSAVLPVANVRVRYASTGDPATPIAAQRRPKGANFLGVLMEAPPAEVPLPAGAAGVTQPVWLTVKVPADAKPGAYQGVVGVRVNEATFNVPLSLTVADFSLPNVSDFVSCADMMESPESVALQYDVPLWSDAHWALLDKVFERMGEMGVKSVFIPIIARTNNGNAESMVRWLKQADGSYRHDFTIVEKYLDLTVKHLGKIPAVCFYVWTPAHGGGSFGSTPDTPKNAAPMYFTMWDPEAGKAVEATGPDWGAPESVPFWKPVFEGLTRCLAARGLEKSMAIGLACDFTPSKQAVDDLKAVAPDVPWAIHSHGITLRFAGMPIAHGAFVWGIHPPRTSSNPQRKYGWQNKVLTTVFARYGAGSMGHVRSDSALGVYHALIECYQASGFNGFGRYGSDFWSAIKGPKGATSVLSRFSYRDRPGPPTMTNATMLFPAQTGPVATVRFEVARVGQQEAEARIVIEKVLLNKEKRAKLGEEKAKAAQSFLDERVEGILRAKGPHAMSNAGSDVSWNSYCGTFHESAEKLFHFAAEAQKQAD